jgi:site-specific recombinase XerD
MAETLPALPVDLSDLAARAAEFARCSRSAATERAYRSDWADFSGWCERAGLSPLPAAPATVGAYLSDRAGRLKVATLNRRIAAITGAHRIAGLGLDGRHPAIARVLAGIRRAYGTRQEAKTAILTEDLRRVVRALPTTTVAGLRDKAVLLVGFAGAFRRSELAALDRGDVSLTPGGVVLTIRRSKTDQEGHGRQVGIPRSRQPATCPVAALEAWLNATDALSAIVNAEMGLGQPRLERPVFQALDHGKPGDRLSGQAVAEIVKRAVSRLGFDPRKFAGHSLRSGFATSAARGGADLAAIMEQTGHKNADVARRYVQRGKLLQNPASKAVKL